MAETEAKERIAKESGDLMLWLGVLAGPVVWLLHLQTTYSLVQTACDTGEKWPLHLASLVAILLVTLAGAVSWRALQQIPERSTDEGKTDTTRARFMAILGLATSALFGLIIVAAEIPNWMLHACD